MNGDRSPEQPLSREEKMQRLRGAGIPRAKDKSPRDPTMSYGIGVLAALGLWGLLDPRWWYFANIALLAFFVYVRRNSRFQVPWLLEMFPILAFACFVLSAYFKREEVFSPYEKLSDELVSTIWLATFCNYAFIFSCLFMIERQIPTGETVTLAVPEYPIPRKWIVRMYLFGLVLNTTVRFMVGGEFRVLVISFGNLEIVALLILLYQSLAGCVGFRREQSKWALAGMVFWFLREVASTLFGGPVAVLLGVGPLFARYVKPWAVLVAVAFGLVFVPLIQGVKKQVRASTAEEGLYKKQAESIPKVFARNVDKIIIQGDWAAYRKGFDEFVERIYITGMVYQIKTNVDQTHRLAEGKTLVNSIFWNLIPRFIYPSKPITGGSSDLARDYGGLFIEEGTSVGIGSIAEFYINFGYAGAVICMALFGGLYGLVMGRMFRHPLQPFGYIYAALTFVSVIRPEINLADSFGGALRAVFLWFVVQWYLTKRVQREYQTPPRQFMPPPGFFPPGMPPPQ